MREAVPHNTRIIIANPSNTLSLPSLAHGRAAAHLPQQALEAAPRASLVRTRPPRACVLASRPRWLALPPRPSRTPASRAPRGRACSPTPPSASPTPPSAHPLPRLPPPATSTAASKLASSPIYPQLRRPRPAWPRPCALSP
ncbi:hypothetical protein PVAP13_5KG309814 [Panicum virgatum]|uniref:Uncharacterized protein n=1 Tax=Panicum virgatum TaxID=38727 RepID=A0A8T0SIF3_PANVG|nr:hypothetical protein PVAP13_5KG309814 [Panicum virgatum]